MKIYDFTVIELNYFRTYCNFTLDERQLFELRGAECPSGKVRGVNECKRVNCKTHEPPGE